MPSFKKLALIATDIYGKTSSETADTATDPKTITPAVFQNGREVINESLKKINRCFVISGTYLSFQGTIVIKAYLGDGQLSDIAIDGDGISLSNGSCQQPFGKLFVLHLRFALFNDIWLQ